MRLQTIRRRALTALTIGTAAYAVAAPSASAYTYEYKGTIDGYFTVVDTDSCGANGHSCTRAYQIKTCGDHKISGRTGVADLFYYSFYARSGWSACATSFTPRF